MKLYDFDGMFDEKLSEYIAKNAGKYKEEEWENIIPVLYNKFGDTVIRSLGKTPRQFYAAMSDGDLIGTLKTHLGAGVPFCRFLADEIEQRPLKSELLGMLDGSDAERECAMNLLGADDKAIPKYMEILVSAGNADLKSRCAELIKEKADLAADQALENYNLGVEKEYMCEILSRTVIKREEIFNVLLKEFRTDADNIPQTAGNLAAYGDERALPYLLDRIDEEGVTYLEFRELKFAIEALGGEYEKEKDFSDDPCYRLIKDHSPEVTDLFASFIEGKKA